MLTEQYKDTVFFSNLFKLHYPQQYKEIKDILDANLVRNYTLKGTKDYWCRDFMPIQWGVKNMVQFAYNPDYLKDKVQFRTNCEIIERITQHYSLLKQSTITQNDIILDGGNIVVCESKGLELNTPHTSYNTIVVMTEKIFADNKIKTRDEIISELKDIFYGQEFLFLPWEGSELDEYGHTDSLIHNIGKAKVLVNLEVYSEDIAEEIYKSLSEHFEVIELKLSEYHPNSWAYINMLQTRDVIIVPALGLKTDQEAFEQIKSLHPEYEDRIYQVNLAPIVNEFGGALNCLSWTISTQGSALHHSKDIDIKFNELFSKVLKSITFWDVISKEEANFLMEYNPVKCEECKRLADWYFGF